VLLDFKPPIHHPLVGILDPTTFYIERNLVDKMIDLHWDPEEEKYLHKSLFDYACEISGYTGVTGLSVCLIFHLY
jgi:hypothetical protein